MKALTLAADLGGSNTRIITEDEKVQVSTNTIRHVVGSDVNDFSTTPKGEFIIKESPISTINNATVGGDFYAKDESIASYSGIDIIPDNQTHKVTQPATFINLIHAIATNIKDEQTVNLGLCIPVVEMYQTTAGKMFIKNISGRYTVEFPRLGQTVKFNIDASRTQLQGEGIIAFADYAIDKKMIDKFKTRIILVIDAGYRSTELILVKNMNPMLYSAVSPELGGINLEAEVDSLLHKQNVLGADTRQLIRSGELRTQQGKMPAGKLVRISKQLLANQLSGEIVTMATRTKEVRNVKNITDIFVTGRCFSMEGKEDNFTGNLAEYIKEALGLQAAIYRADSLANANIVGTFKQLKKFAQKSRS